MNKHFLKILAITFLFWLPTRGLSPVRAETLEEEDPEMLARANAAYLQSQISQASPYRGWDYLTARLKTDGVPEEEIAAVFKNEKMPFFSYVPFSLKPRDSSRGYGLFTSMPRIKTAWEFLKKNKEAFISAEKIFKVNRHLIAAIILVETNCGQFTGNHLVVERLARVASAAAPVNVQFNYETLHQRDKTITLEQVKERAAFLEQTFYPEMLALLEMARRGQADLFELKGSYAGAFGIPQFLPSSYLKYAVDGDKDGIISLFSPADAIWSAAHYLAGYGWKDDASIDEKKKVLWGYNRSHAYAEAVLKVSILLRQKEEQEKESTTKPSLTISEPDSF